MTWEFERMIEQAQRDAKAAASRQQAAQEREEAQRAAHQKRLRQILYKAPLMAKALTEKGEKGEPTDIKLILRRWQEARKGLRRRVSGEWVEEPYVSGWTVIQDIESYSTEGNRTQGVYHHVRGVLLSPDGTIMGYNSGVDTFVWRSLRDKGQFRVNRLTVGAVKELTPQEPWPNRKGTTRYYFLPSGADEYYGYFTLEDILNKLAAFVVEHRIDPSTLSGP